MCTLPVHLATLLPFNSCHLGLPSGPTSHPQSSTSHGYPLAIHLYSSPHSLALPLHLTHVRNCVPIPKLSSGPISLSCKPRLRIAGHIYSPGAGFAPIRHGGASRFSGRSEVKARLRATDARWFLRLSYSPHLLPHLRMRRSLSYVTCTSTPL